MVSFVLRHLFSWILTAGEEIGNFRNAFGALLWKLTLLDIRINKLLIEFFFFVTLKIKLAHLYC